MSFYIINGDVTKMETDAVVNAANPQLSRGGGVCGAIFAAAGSQQLDKECRDLAPCPVGHAVITDGYALPAEYIVHAVGPIWHGGEYGEAELLHDAYINSLRIAWDKGCRSIAFPLISSGIYGYPKKEAMDVAKKSIGEFLEKYDMDVYLVLF